MGNFSKGRTIYILIFTTYLGFVLLGLAKHELWGDELQAWGIARNANGPLSLYYNNRYEGNPGLWHLVLFFATRFTGNPEYIKVVHFIVATIFGYLLIFKTKLPSILKFLIPFSYYPIYEYSVISRNYMLGMLFGLLLILELVKKEKNYIKISLYSIIISATSVHALTIAIGLNLLVYWEIIPKILSKNIGKLEKNYYISTLCLTIAGFALTLLLATPPKDTSNRLTRLYKDINLMKETVGAVWEGFVPIISSDDPYWWSSNFVLDRNIKFILSIGILGFVAAGLAKDKKALAAFFVGTGLYFALNYIKYPGTVRHHGHIFFLLIFISVYVFSKRPDNYKLLKYVLVALLILQIYAGYLVYIKDIKEDFSYEQEAAKYIKENNLENWDLVGDTDIGSVEVAIALDKKIYLPKMKAEQGFAIHQIRRLTDMQNEVRTLNYAYERNLDKKNAILLALTYKLNTEKYPVTYLQSFDKDYAVSRELHLYKFEPERMPGLLEDETNSSK